LCKERLSPFVFPVSVRCLLLIIALSAAQASAQTVTGDQPYEISSVEFEGNATFSASELRAQFATRETPGFFNKFLFHSISEQLGRKNEYFNPNTFSADLERVKRFYENRGFSDVRIDTMLRFSDDDRSVDIRVVLHEGYRSVIDTLAYRGIREDPGPIWSDIRSSPRIKQGDPFNSMLLEEEVKRVLRIMNDAGYANAAFRKDSSSARRYLSTRNYTVVLDFDMGRRFLFGPIGITQEIDTLRGSAPRTDITDDIILRQLDYREGDIYSLNSLIASEQNLNRLGILDLRSIDKHVPANSDTSILIPTSITIHPRDKQELAPELLFSDENSAFNIGTGLGYTNRNLLGGARIFTASAQFRTQTPSAFPDYFGINTGSVANLEVSMDLLQPYVFTNKIKGDWTLSYIVEKQKPYRQEILRNKIGLNDRFAEYTTGFLDWTLERVRLATNGTYFLNVADSALLQQLEVQEKPQFNSILSFTIQRDMTNDIFSPSSGFFHSATIEESGVLPLLLEGGRRDLPFTQFYRVSALGRWYFDLSGTKFSILGLKLKGGLEEKYGESRSDTSRTIPQTHRFYGGGGGSVRGWNSRDLIASSDPQAAQLGGNLAFEGTVELRTNLLQNLRDGLLDKIWVVQFLDWGNVWPEVRDFQVRTIAIAAGLGFRYDTFFGPFRIDWGFRVYNPMAQPSQQWITQRKLLGQTFKEAIFHFGIGHAF